MKSSKYNVYFYENGRFYIFNQLSGALTEVDQELFDCLKNNRLNTESISDELLQEMETSHIICDENLKEEFVVLSANKMFRFSNVVARVTILPTLNCNFKCWYCYESHIESKMSKEGLQSTLEFCRNIIQSRTITCFHLDWFGGEPLLYFDEIMYPLSLAIKQLCDEQQVKFSHSITTNGYLVTEEIIAKMDEIGLTSFQITLDGSEFYHNKTRFSKEDKQTYHKIVDNITSICQRIKNVNMSVRVNYTPKNLHSIDQIAYDFPMNVRHKISIQPQLVWQFKDVINEIDDLVKEKLDVFIKEGYKKTKFSIPHLHTCCYAENMKQYVINYDLSVYKCTARNFVNEKYSIGKISKGGQLITNSNYYNYFISSYMENPTCLACEYLPSCCGMCIQKKVENKMPQCPKGSIKKSVLNRLKLLIQNS